MALRTGQTLASYRLVEKLGAGGMGEVWKALDTRLDRHVALKVLPDEAARDVEKLKRLELEAKTVAALNHPNIVTLHSVEEAEGIRFLTMELIEGRTLGEVVSKGAVTLDRFFELALALTDALTAAHERGVVHRDLKPANVMVGNDGRLKVLDFGLAKLREPPEGAESPEDISRTFTQMTGVGRVAGTIPYMSPEQLQGKSLDARTDLFALGVVLYELATGDRPFHGHNSVELISSILRDPTPPLSRSRREFPNHVGRIIRQCLEKDPDRRFQSAKEVGNALRSLKLEISESRLPQPVAVGARRLPRVRTAIAAAVVVAAGALLAAVLLLREGSEAPGPPNAVAVLPFANLTGEAALDFVSQGIGAGLITQLSEVTGIRVVGRTAAWAESGTGASPGEAARRLGVTAYLEGEVRKDADRLRVEVKLTHAESGLVLWSQKFDGRTENLFALQERIARDLTSVLAVPLSRRELRRMSRNPTRSLAAYEFFLKGHQRLQARGASASERDAVELLRQAIRLDPEFALARAGLSEALWRLYHKEGGSELLAEAEREARAALEIDGELPSAKVALARVLRSTGRYEQSIEELKRVLADHPKPDEAQRALAASYDQIGDLAQEESCLRAAAALGGEDWFNWNLLGSFYQRVGRYDDARGALETATRYAGPDVGVPHESLAALLVLEGKFDEAIAAYRRIPGPVSDPVLASNIGTAYYFSGEPERLTKAEEFYALAVRLDPRNPVIRRNLADVHVDLGRRDEALHHYREALRLVEDPLRVDPGNPSLRLQKALYAAKAESCGEAVALGQALAAELPETAQNFHQLAHVFATCGRREEALSAIRTAVRLGFSSEIIRREEEFRDLRGLPEFSEALAQSPPPP